MSSELWCRVVPENEKAWCKVGQRSVASVRLTHLCTYVPLAVYVSAGDKHGLHLPHVSLFLVLFGKVIVIAKK